MNNAKPGTTIKIAETVRNAVNQDGAVLLDIEQGLCFSMNPVGAKIWEMLKEGLSREAIVEGLKQEFQDVSRAQLEQDLSQFLKDLETRKLLRSQTQQEPKRRNFLSRFFDRQPA